ncbi:acyl-CoA synthetase [Streptomyces mangrovisoli]|uniref:Acyl-CoA synthetase n=1 Tax=Streptomyces mangrovisoli TaxID=1428628 RepID=A0A1J4NXQ8_9ACTN|nr:acyl-CoA synthetase [Streptomyces mangrovisoli]OIJ66013.1 acyl-CoA synthetase [Streptomyces mangrovisoli]
MYPGAHVRTSPDRPAVVMAETGRTLTYAELEQNSLRLANALRAAGLARGDVVAVVSDNAVEVFEVYWAALRSGLYVTAVNRHLAPAEVAYVINDSGARALVVSAELGELARAVAAETPGVALRLAFGGDVPGHDSYTATLAAVSATPRPYQPRGADMLYSSGTTGRPKGIKPPLPDRQVHEPGDIPTALFGPLYGFGPDTVYLSPAPVYHAAPLRFGGVVHAYGGTVVMMRHFDAERALSAIERHRVTHTQWVPTMFVRALKLPPQVRTRYDLSSLRVAIHAAAPCPVNVKRAMIDWWGPIVHEYYAATEGSGLTFIDTAAWLRRPGSVGRALLGTLRICADDGRELPSGQVGTVYFERDEPAFEYHNDPERTRAAQHPLHPYWTTTGDVGHVDAQGYLFLADRRDFVIISGGVNIYPQEVENALALHPKVADTAVIGLPDPEMGQEVRAVVAVEPGVRPGPHLERELIAYVRERIAHYKAPRHVDFVDSLPRTPTGKLLKRVLVDRYRRNREYGLDDR